MTGRFGKLDFEDDEGREDIYKWSERRRAKYQGFRKSIYVFRIFALDLNIMRSFVESINIMVIIQMLLAGLVTYICRITDIKYDVHVALFVSPIVFPLAFSINTDFVRREKVLDDLANFKSSAMMWFFCMRDWRESCGFEDLWMRTSSNKIKALLFHLREFLLTQKEERREFLVKVIYEDLSDTNQLLEKVRCSKMPTNAPLVARVLHFENQMCLSFERLRVIREYRSPRSIRSFTKVIILLLPLVLSPYYIFLGEKVNNKWCPYYIAVLVALVFGALQGVQDKLDDPFDGMSEDDINLDTLDEWTLHSLEATALRTYKIGRFEVSTNPDVPDPVANHSRVASAVAHSRVASAVGLSRVASAVAHSRGASAVQPMPQQTLAPPEMPDAPRRKHNIFGNLHRRSSNKVPLRSQRSIICSDEDASMSEDIELHPFAGVLSNLPGNATILPGGHIKKRDRNGDELVAPALLATAASGANQEAVIPPVSVSFSQVVFGGSDAQINFRSMASASENQAPDIQALGGMPSGLKSLFASPIANKPDQIAISMPEADIVSAFKPVLTSAGKYMAVEPATDSSSSDEGLEMGGVASYLASTGMLRLNSRASNSSRERSRPRRNSGTSRSSRTSRNSRARSLASSRASPSGGIADASVENPQTVAPTGVQEKIKASRFQVAQTTANSLHPMYSNGDDSSSLLSSDDEIADAGYSNPGHPFDGASVTCTIADTLDSVQVSQSKLQKGNLSLSTPVLHTAMPNGKKDSVGSRRKPLVSSDSNPILLSTDDEFPEQLREEEVFI